MIERFICAGSLNVDITFPVERLPEEHEKLPCGESYLAYGGAAANTAHWLARLGLAVQMLGCVGDDPFGTLCCAALDEVRVDTRHIQRTRQGLMGMAAVFVNPASKRMVVSSGANVYFDPSAVRPDLFAPGTLLHVATSMNDIALPLMRLAKQRGASVSCDLDGGPTSKMLPWLDIVLINHSDPRRWVGSDDPHEARKRLAPDTRLIVTQGARGVMALGPSEEVFHPAFPASVVDRTGGGDAFDAGFLYGLAQGRPLTEYLRLGLWLAAQVIAARGSRPQAVDLTLDPALTSPL